MATEPPLTVNGPFKIAVDTMRRHEITRRQAGLRVSYPFLTAPRLLRLQGRRLAANIEPIHVPSSWCVKNEC